MHKKNLTIEETFALAFQNHQKNNLKVAENLYKEILEINPNHAATHKLLDKKEGSIILELCGDDYPEDKKLPSIMHPPKVYDLILFPSSLFHRTIPFKSNDERHSIAFDLVPK